MFQRVAFGELSEFFTSVRHHLTDMTPTEILTVAPLAALTVVFGLFPGLVLDLVRGSVTRVLADVGREGAVPISPPAAFIAIALPVLYLVGRTIWVARIDLGRVGRGGSSGQPDLEPGAVATTEAAS
jgi:hypothetical protein